MILLGQSFGLPSGSHIVGRARSSCGEVPIPPAKA
jgi:hypothetical protein